MPYLYCQKHGKEAIEFAQEQTALSEESSEYTKVICGLLRQGFYCDRCNQKLPPHSLAYLFQYFPNSKYESPKDFAEYFDEPIFVAYKPDKEYSLAENYITLSEIKNILPDDLQNLFKKIGRVRHF